MSYRRPGFKTRLHLYLPIKKTNKSKLCVELQNIDGLVEEDVERFEKLMCKRMEVMADLERILKAEEIFWYQNAKCKWLLEGNENMSFFSQGGKWEETKKYNFRSCDWRGRSDEF